MPPPPSAVPKTPSGDRSPDDGARRAAGSRGPSFVLEAQARLNWVAARQLPRLDQMRATLAAQASGQDCELLLQVLPDHLDALAALQFERLVPPGLRAGPLPRDEAAFRAEVARVSGRTEATWAAIRAFVDQGALQAATVAEDFADFILEVRSIQRTQAELAPAADDAARELDGRLAAAATEVSRRALAELQHRVAHLQARLVGLRELCESGHRAQRLAYQLADEAAACRASLKQVAQLLAKGLLDHLGALLAPGELAKADALAQAQAARAQLQAELRQALERIAALQACRGDLRQALAGLGEQCRSAAHDASARW